MSKIRSAFENGKAFIPFITCGDPNLETTAKIVREAVANGADLIELGIPFSDPTAEGPVIQGANIKALAAGVTTDKVFDLVRDLRKDVTIPMVFMTYANVKVIRENTYVPCAIGFGISTPKQAKKMADISDGAIVGSAIIKIIDEYGEASPKYVGEYVKAMKDAL